jgi:predicted GIY-YIG superfamily endonuclease
MVGHMAFVYILKSTQYEWYYVGSTSRSVEERLIEHNALKVSSTKAKAPLVVVWMKNFPTEQEARAYEKMLKQKRSAKEEIISSL